VLNGVFTFYQAGFLIHKIGGMQMTTITYKTDCSGMNWQALREIL